MEREPTGAVVREVKGYRVHCFEGVDYLSVSTVLKVCRFGELDPGIPAHILEAARDRGAAVGHMIALHAQGKLDVGRLMADDAYAPLRPFWAQYEAFLQESTFLPERSEELVQHPAWRVFGYVDLCGWVQRDCRRVVIELKTGKKVYDAARLQTAAYGEMLDMYASVLQLTGNGDYRLTPVTPDDARDFAAAAQVAHRYLGTRG